MRKGHALISRRRLLEGLVLLVGICVAILVVWTVRQRQTPDTPPIHQDLVLPINNGGAIRVIMSGYYPERLGVHDDSVVMFTVVLAPSLEIGTTCTFTFDAPGLSVHPPNAPAFDIPPRAEHLTPDSIVSPGILFSSYKVSSATPGLRIFSVMFDCNNGLRMGFTRSIVIYENISWFQIVSSVMQTVGIPTIIGILLVEYFSRRRERLNRSS